MNRNYDDIKPYIKNKRILDIGAGAGKTILPFAGEGSVGMDKEPKGEVIYGDAVDFHLGKTFEVITICSLIEHLANKQQVLKVFKNAYDHLEPDGLIIVQCPHAYDYGAWYDFWHELPFTHHSVKMGLKLAGFMIEKAWTHLRLPKDQWFVRRFGVISIPISSDYVIRLLTGINLARDVVVVGKK